MEVAREEGEIEATLPAGAAAPVAPVARVAPVESAAQPTPAAFAATNLCDGSFRALDPASVRVERIGWWIMTVIAAVATLPVASLALALNWFGTLVGGLVLVGAACFTAILVWLTLTWPAMEHRHARWAVGALGIEIRRGVFWKQVISVPRSRVQHTDVLQGPLQRRFGLATLTIHTAGTQHASVSLSGLAHGAALAVRDHLLHGGERDGV